MSIQRPRGSLLKKTQLSSLTKYQSQLQELPQNNCTALSTTNRGRNRNNTTQNNRSRSKEKERNGSETSSVSNGSETRNRSRNRFNNNKENAGTNRSKARSKSRTRNNGYQKPLNFQEMKEKLKIYRKQISEVNEVNNRLNEEKEDLEDELKNIHQRNAFETQQKDKKIYDLERYKMQIENENNLNKQKLMNQQNEIDTKNSQIEMAESAKRALEQQIRTLNQSIQMKDNVLNNNKQQILMMNKENKMIQQNLEDKKNQIQCLTHNLHKLQNENQSNSIEMKSLREENMTISLKNTSLNNMNENQLRKIRELNEMVQKQQQQIAFNNERMQRMQKEIHTLSQQRQILQKENECQSQRINEQNHEISKLVAKGKWYEEKARKDEEVRKRLHNEIQELKGNIRVFCRVRPMFDGNDSVYKFDDDDIEQQSITLLTPSTMSGISGKLIEGKTYNFDFDRVFRPFMNQEIVFDEISQLIQSALDGYKVCIFAYGQTGSGKTYTMEGPSINCDDINRGMIPRSVEKIFEHKEKLKNKGWNYKCVATYLEIYNEKIRDLLTNNNNNNRFNNQNDQQIRYLEIRQKKSNENSKKTDIYVDGLKEIQVSSPFDVYPLLKLASRNRSVGRTDCNERSSRSHSVFQLYLTGYNDITRQSTFGVLNLIDLAGSERLKKSNATGIQLKETQNINKSLSCLGDVIAALSSKKNRSHIPYRNSKLTYLLMNYFGGDAKTLMFVNLCPEKDKIDESLCSLRFAAKVNDCHIGIAKRNC